MTDVVQVECHSGYTYAEEPRAVIWQGQRFEVEAVEARWRAPEGPAFWVRTSEAKRFELHYHEVEDRWAIRIIGQSGHSERCGVKILGGPTEP